MMKNEKIIKKIWLLLFAMLCSVIGAMLWINGGFKQGGLLRLGEVYDFSAEELKAGSETCIYDDREECFVIQSDHVELYFNIESNKKVWRDCTVTLKNTGKIPVLWSIQFFNAKGRMVFEDAYTLGPGTNHLQIGVRKKVQTMKITMDNQMGRTFQIKDMKLRQKYFDTEDFLKKTIVIFILCVVIYIIAVIGRRINWYVWLDMLQNIYIWLGNFGGTKTVAVLSRKLREKLRVVCFFLMFLLMIIMDATSGGNYTLTTRYWLLGQGVLLFFTGILSWEKSLKKLDWKNSLCFSWLLLWSIVCISDLFVQKSFSYVGYIMLFCAGFAFFVWNQTNFAQVYKNMLQGLKWTFVPVILYCILFRQKKVGVYYNGCFAQPENMAMYALALLIVFLMDLKVLLEQEEMQKIKMHTNGIGIVLSSFFVYYSGIAWCFWAAVMVIAIWTVIQIIQLKVWKERFVQLLGIGVVTILCGGILTLGVKYGIQTLPEKLGTSIIYENEIQKTDLPEGIMYALEAQQPGWMEGVVRDTTESRQKINRKYIQQLNLQGNEGDVTVGSTYANSSNGILQMAHRYGMFILVPYLMMLGIYVLAVMKTKQFERIAMVTVFVVGLFWGNPEMPFTQPLWLMFYLGMGQWFGNKEKEDMRLEVTYENCD